MRKVLIMVLLVATLLATGCRAGKSRFLDLGL